MEQQNGIGNQEIKSINDELQNINEKILNLNNSNNINNTNNESTSNKNSTIPNNNINNNTFSPSNEEFNSPTIKNIKKIYNKNRIIYPTQEEKLLLSNTIITERQKSVKHLEKFKTSYPKELIYSSQNISKKKNLQIKDKTSIN